ncbi:MAG: tRNA epoxyqueuosine(34) reductase QueG [Myxococcota bacterium]
MTDLKSELVARALALGFARVGVARAEPLTAAGARLRVWLQRGFHGEMRWMEDTAEVRCDVGHEGMLPSATSVVVLCTPYSDGAPAPQPLGASIARYAVGRDYHNVLHKRLRKLASFLRAAGHRVRASVDSLPVFERAWAERAGVGFIGKNACLIVPGIGSHVFLSTLVTDAELPADEPMKERCGSCTLCLDACPTQAFAAPRQLDARRCISYLTIEHRGPIPEEQLDQVSDWLFGCDVCQDVCPFNRGRGEPFDASAFAPHPRWHELTVEEVFDLDEAAFAERFQGSPVRRAGRDGFLRNAAAAVGRTGDRRHLPLVRERAATDSSALVRDACRRTVETLSKPESD